MFDNLVNCVIGGLVAAGLYFYCDVPVEEALRIGFMATITYTLSDISRHLRSKK